MRGTPPPASVIYGRSRECAERSVHRAECARSGVCAERNVGRAERVRSMCEACAKRVRSVCEACAKRVRSGASI